MDSYRGASKTTTTQTLNALPSGLPGVKQTLAYMRAFVNQYKTAPQIRELAISLVRDLPQKAYSKEVEALFSFVKNRIRYTRDTNGVEVVQSPIKTLEYASGDCDDKATLLATLLESIGFETEFYAVGFSRGELSHVLLKCEVNGEWIALETTEPVAMGWTPPNPTETLRG